MRIMGIYKITNNITKKIYIGQSVDIYQRWQAHKSIGLDPSSINHKNQLYYDMYKLGIENFSFEIIEEVSFKQLNDREKYWIQFYDSFNNGYNLTRGGRGNNKYDYDYIYQLWLQKIPVALIAKELNTTSSTINTILESFNITTEEKYQQSAERIKKSYSQYSKKVYQKDLKTHKVINIFNSVSEAASYLKVKRATFREALLKHNGEYRNFYWAIDNNSQEKEKNFSSKKVAQIDKITNEIIQIYPSVSAAARAVKSNTSNISNVCRGGRAKTVKGYKWKYIENEE